MNAITIGLDIAKSVFQVHGEDSSSKVVVQKRLKRAQVERFFAELPRLWASKRAARRTTGAAACRRWAMMCG